MDRKRIFAAFRMAYSSNREFITGISRFIRRNRGWHVTLADNFTDFDVDLLSNVESNYDGIITIRPHSREAMNAILKAKIPIAMLGTSGSDFKPKRNGIVMVCGNDIAIGQAAAAHIDMLGAFRSYAYVSTIAKTSWSKAREKGFTSRLRERGEVSSLNSPFPEGSPMDIKYLTEKISALPKPAALMAAYDNRAIQVITACRTASIDIPREVSLIGVDNDCFLCDFATPSLTSISTNAAQKGEAAAAELDRMIRGRQRRSKIIIINDTRVVERETTAPVSPSKNLVERALLFIQSNASADIRPRDVVRHLKVSRSLADERFRKMTGRSLGEEITRVRLDAVKKKLIDTDIPIGRITELCGFTAPNYLKRLFRDNFGMSMKQFREARRAEDAHGDGRCQVRGFSARRFP